MITHVVMFRFEDNSPEHLETVKRKLMALPSVISEIQHYEVGINVVQADRNYDMVLISKFNTLEDLQAYGVHPAHKEVLAYIRDTATSVAVVDYEG
ncbi:MAG: Dabb family protein [Chloroflexi bacterium]|nr:MAG: Dabb family protein [Chloroflexota bacterium]